VEQTRLLARSFFTKLFESDLMPAGLPQVQLMIWSMVLISTPTLTLPGVYSDKYVRLWHHPGTGALSIAIANDRLVLITYAMIAMGFVALVVSENAFPDRRDARILGALPIATRTFVAARLAALSLLFLLFFATLGAIPSIFFGALSAVYIQACGFLRGLLAQFTTVLAATVCVFSAVIAAQALVIVLLGRSFAQRMTMVLQALAVVGLLEMIFFLPSLGSTMGDGNLTPDWLSSPRAAMLPSVWFLGLYEVLSGYGGRNAFPMAGIAAMLTLVSFVSAVSLYALSYARMTSQALEAAPVAASWPRGATVSRWIRSFGRPETGRPIADATRAFTLATIFRSRQHRMLLMLYVGIAVAIIVSSLIPIWLRHGLAAFGRPGIAVLAVPLVMIFCVVVGMRVVFAIPVDVKANWVVKLCEPRDRRAAINGVRSAMLMSGVLPFVLLAAVSAGLLWGVRVSATHAVVCTLLGWLLVELLVLPLRKIPFACIYLPGRSQIQTLWPLYFSAFTAFTYSMAAIEVQMFSSPWLVLVVCSLLAVAIVVVIQARARWLAEQPGLRFVEEEPGSLFEGFQLSEGLAAAGVNMGKGKWEKGNRMGNG
jgi:hypothetical protein